MDIIKSGATYTGAWQNRFAETNKEDGAIYTNPYSKIRLLINTDTAITVTIEETNDLAAVTTNASTTAIAKQTLTLDSATFTSKFWRYSIQNTAGVDQTELDMVLIPLTLTETLIDSQNGIADGVDVTQGAKADAAAASPAATASVVGILKGLWTSLKGTLTVNQLDQASSGTITVYNQNATGVATTGSAVAFNALNNSATVSIHVTANTLNQILVPQISLDGTNWVSLGVTGLVNLNTNAYSATIAAGTSGYWQVSIGSDYAFRMVCQSICTGSASVLLQASPAIANVGIDMPLPPGTNLIGNVGINAVTTGGASFSHLVATNTTNATNIKNTAGKVLGYAISNTSATAFYLKFHNTTAVPTPGSGVVLSLYVPVTSTITGQFAADIGLNFSTGIGITTTAAVADADTAIITAGSILQIIYI